MKGLLSDRPVKTVFNWTGGQAEKKHLKNISHPEIMNDLVNRLDNVALWRAM